MVRIKINLKHNSYYIFIKHKVLDCLGDFYLAGYSIIGEFRSVEPGHELNNKLLKKIFAEFPVDIEKI